jgi:hypothetical protein
MLLHTIGIGSIGTQLEQYLVARLPKGLATLCNEGTRAVAQDIDEPLMQQRAVGRATQNVIAERIDQRLINFCFELQILWRHLWQHGSTIQAICVCV